MPRLAAADTLRKGGISGRVIVEGVERWADFVRLTVVVILRSVAFFGLSQRVRALKDQELATLSAEQPQPAEAATEVDEDASLVKLAVA